MNKRLLSLLPPPKSPLGAPSLADWERYEQEFSPLPTDYKQFVSTYGNGVIDEFLWLMTPTSNNTYTNLFAQSRRVLDALAQSASTLPEYFSMPRFPSVGGFLPMAGTDNGDSIFWVTRGNYPDEWSVAVMGPRNPHCFFFDGNVTSFLVAITERTVLCDVFPADFPSDAPLNFSPREI